MNAGQSLRSLYRKAKADSKTHMSQYTLKLEWDMLKTFKKDISGNFSIVGATMLLGLMGAVGLSVDYMAMTDSRAQLQSATDATKP